MINLLENTSSQPSQFSTKNWVEINPDARDRYNTDSQIRSKTIRIKPS